MEADVNTKTIPTLASVTGETLGVPRMPTDGWSMVADGTDAS